ncbi:MAG: hypothetical protein JWL81_196 [Verrucomicrobiales bacterium]|nr:hypothetical protein [Verrucomicrobiales bacterium]
MKPAPSPAAASAARHALLLGCFLTSPVCLRAADGVWTSTNDGALWSDVLNWAGGVPADGAGASAEFGGFGNNIEGTVTVHLDTDRSLTLLSFTDDDPFSPGNWILDDNGNPSNNLILTDPSPVITVAAASPATITAGIQGTAGLTKKGAGILTLSGMNTFVGGTILGNDSAPSTDTSKNVNAGTLAITGPHALGTGPITIHGRYQNQGKLQLSNNVSITDAGPVSFTNSRQVIGANGGGDGTNGFANIENLSGDNSLNSTLTVAGPGGNGANFSSMEGTLTLTGDFSTSGVTSNRTLSFAGAGNFVCSGIITNGVAGVSILKENAGTLTLEGMNTYSNATVINGGTVRVRQLSLGGVAGNLGASSAISGNLVINNGTLEHVGDTESTNRAFTIPAGATATVSTLNNLSMAGANGAVTTGSLTKTGPGKLTLTGGNTFTGTTLISEGVLQLGDTGLTGKLSPAGLIVTDGVFAIARGNAVTQGVDFSSAPITGSGGFTQAGNGTTTLNAANTYRGDTTVSAGTLTLAPGGQILLKPSVSGVNNRITGAGTVNLDGMLLLDLTGADTTNGNAWTLVDAPNTHYNLTAIASDPVLVWARSPEGVWQAADAPGGRHWTFTETTGVLTLEAPVTAENFTSWAASHGVTGGAGGDSDRDGISNLIEYALQLNPAASDGAAGNFAPATGTLTFTKRPEAIQNGDVSWLIETSPSLAAGSWTPAVTQAAGNPALTLSMIIPRGPVKMFARLKITQAP